MRGLILAAIASAALSLSACDTTGSLQQSPAPLAATSADEHALLYAFESYEFVLDRVDDWRDSGKLVPGTPKALQVQGWLVKIRDGLTAARAARKAGSVTDYEAAFANAQEALRNVKLLLK